MILTFDIESQGWTKEFLCGTICKENHKTETYTNQKEMWQRILQLAEKEKDRQKNTYAYAHNLIFDFFRLAEYKNEKGELDKHILQIRPTRPPIVLWGEEQQKPHLWFLDSYSILKYPLETIGTMIGEPKKELPKELSEKLYKQTKQKWTNQEIEELKEYNKQDAIVTMKAIQYMKENLAQLNVKPRKMITIGQIAIQAFNKHIKKTRNYHKFYQWNKFEKGKLNIARYYDCPDIPLVKNGYRGARVEALQIGEYENCTMVDNNSFYPYCATKTSLPDLSNPRIIIEPLKNYTDKELYKQYGMSKVALRKTTSGLGSIPIHYKSNEEYPRERNKVIIGTYTHTELEYALKNGYETIAIEKSLIYGTLYENTLANLMNDWYIKRKENQGQKLFYKEMMNNLISKFGQKQTQEETTESDIDDKPNYEGKGWEPIAQKENKMIYSKIGSGKLPNYYAPIIPANVTALSRNIMHEHMKQIPDKDLLYAAADGILYKQNHHTIFEQGEKMGQWKIVQDGDEKIQNQKAKIWAKGSYGFPNLQRWRIVGIGKKFINQQNTKTGKVTHMKMKNTTRTTIDELGEFEQHEDDLNKRGERQQERLQGFNEIETYIDEYETDLQYFIKQGII